MKKLLAIIVLGLLCSCTSIQEPSSMRNNSIKSDNKVKILNYTDEYIKFIVDKRSFVAKDPTKNKEWISTAKNHCHSKKKDVHLAFKEKDRKWSGWYPFSYHWGIDNNKPVYVYICSNSLDEATNIANNTALKGGVFYMNRSPIKFVTYKRIISQQEIAENKKQALENKRKAAALKKQQRDNLITKLENIYSKDCTGGLLNKKFEKGTKEFENCLLEKDKTAKAKLEAEKKAIAKRQIEIDKKLAAMTPKERHAYNCSTAFKFRKGTEKYNDCVFKLYTAELDMQKLELEKQVAEAQIQAAANQQARAEAVANAQIAAAKAAKRAASLNSSIQLMQMGSSMLGSSAPKSNSSFGIENRVRTTCRNVGGFINCN
jgi:hypothetical protein